MHQPIKKSLTLIATIVIVNMIAMTTTSAQTSDEYLRQIRDNTSYGTKETDLTGINRYLYNLNEYTKSWLDKDFTQQTNYNEFRADFIQVGNDINSSMNEQMKLDTQQKLMAAIVGRDVKDFQAVGTAPSKIALDIPDINNLAFSSVVGILPAAKGDFDKLSYIKNAVGAGVTHLLAPPTGGTKEAVINYKGLYNTITSIESYNAYVLSSLMNDQRAKSDNVQKLITMAGSDGWLVEVGAASLGVVLRQLLIFESQIFMLLVDLQKLQRESLTAQVMTNSLLIVGNQQNESIAYSKATGAPPSAR